MRLVPVYERGSMVALMRTPALIENSSNISNLRPSIFDCTLICFPFYMNSFSFFFSGKIFQFLAINLEIIKTIIIIHLKTKHKKKMQN